MASRFETVPEDFLQHLNESFAEFSAESERHKFALARMAWIGLTKGNQHSHFHDAISFSSSEIEAAFGRSKFTEVNLRLNFFNRTTNWSKDDGYTRGYMFSSATREVIKKYLDRPARTTLTRLVMADGKALGKIPAGVASKDKKDVTTTAWKSAKALKLVSVNLESLERLKRELMADAAAHRAIEAAIGRLHVPELEAVERTIAMISKVEVLSRAEPSGLGFMAHHYQEAQSGRLYPLGISLASAQSVVKDAALEGRWEYDISNCHFVITLQMALRHGYRCVEIEKYHGGTRAIRQSIADDVGVHVEHVKTCLLALLYGARGTTWRGSAIVETLGEESAAKMLKNPTFLALKGDIAHARKKILKMSERTSKGSIKNAFGKSISNKSKKEQQFAHLLQGVEAKALQSVINAYPDDIVLVQHDGFVSRKRLDVAEISAVLFSATGYNLHLKEVRLKALPGDYFATHL